jgi:hypothetical protein
MSRRSSTDDATPDVYTGLLAVSLSALIIGILLLVLELKEYGNVFGA